jgi:predicted nucleotidyltransferase
MNVEQLLVELVALISQVDGVEAIVLGGSRARGTHTASSDVDLGIYYDPNHPLDLAALAKIATALDDQHRPDLLTQIGGWGPWINGGGWLTISSTPVDFLYRDLTQVAQVITACHAGQLEVAYQPGHPHAFVSSIYMGEVAVCHPLWDRHGRLAILKAQTIPYPRALQQALIQRFAWEANFSLQTAHKAAGRGDVAYVAGCAFRSVACLLQTLFALNEQYWLNEKGAVALASTFRHSPPQWQARLDAAFAQLSSDPLVLADAVAQLQVLTDEVQQLVNPAAR